MSPSESSTLDKSVLQASNTSPLQHPVPPVTHRPRRLRPIRVMRMTDLTTHQSNGIVSRLSIAVISAIALSLGSCASNAPSSNSASQAQSPTAATTDELQVVTTFLPITQFTKAVAGDRAEVTQLLPTNVGPHDYQAKPEDAQRLAKADVLVQNGLEMEEFLEDLVKNAGNANLKVIDSSQSVQTITTESIEGEAHDHNHEHGANERAEAEHGHDHGKYNPHIWLDPKRAIQQVENIRDGLIAADPAGKDVYTANAAAYIQKLRDLDIETSQLLQPYAGKTFVAFHDFAPYFAASYNLKANFLVDVPEENPSPDDVKRVIDTVQATNLKTLLTEPQGGQDAFAALANDLNVRVSTFDPMETGGPEALQPDYYLTTMRSNVQALVTAFTGQSTQSFLPLWSTQPIALVPQPVGIRF
ncbi:MAG TPA: zinc ABC transporter substrate-binding protein [Trichocoleus sp.]